MWREISKDKIESILGCQLPRCDWEYLKQCFINLAKSQMRYIGQIYEKIPRMRATPPRRSGGSWTFDIDDWEDVSGKLLAEQFKCTAESGLWFEKADFLYPQSEIDD